MVPDGEPRGASGALTARTSPALVLRVACNGLGIAQLSPPMALMKYIRTMSFSERAPIGGSFRETGTVAG